MRAEFGRGGGGVREEGGGGEKDEYVLEKVDEKKLAGGRSVKLFSFVRSSPFQSPSSPHTYAVWESVGGRVGGSVGGSVGGMCGREWEEGVWECGELFGVGEDGWCWCIVLWCG